MPKNGTRKSNLWQEALKEYNSKRSNWLIPKAGSKDHAAVKKIQAKLMKARAAEEKKATAAPKKQPKVSVPAIDHANADATASEKSSSECESSDAE